MWKDLRYAARVLAASPGFSLVVILSLALAIGANTTVFSIVNAFLIRPMPVDHPDRVVAVYVTSPHWGNNIDGLSYPQWQDYTRQNTGLSEIVGFNGAQFTITDGDKPELVWGEYTTANYFSGLGVHPTIGRGFLPDEEQSAKAVCVINYNFWQRRFHSDPDIAGKTIRIDGHPLTIVGVAPRHFIGAQLFSFIPDIWVPVRMDKTLDTNPDSPDLAVRRDIRFLNIRARLNPGVTPQQAETALNLITRRLAAEYPKTDAEVILHVIPAGARTLPWLYASGLQQSVTGIMSAVVLLVLLIACANVANLLLARGAARAREIGIRVAVGATRWRLVRQLFAESLLLSLAGALGGTLLALWFNSASLRFYPTLDFSTVDITDATRPDPMMFVFAILLSLAAAAIFGIIPAFRASRSDQLTAIKAESNARFRSGNALVMVQVALSCVLLVVGGLFLRSMQFAHAADLGFHRNGITLFSVNLDLQGYKEKDAAAFEQKMMEHLRAIPGVEDAAFAFPLPLDAYGGPTTVFPEGWQPRSEHEQNIAGNSRVSPHYFSTMGTQIIAGRAIDERDTAPSKLVAVINETMARRYWGSPEAALGRRFSETRTGPQLEIVGVARNGKYISFGEGDFSYTFTSIAQDHPFILEVLLRSPQPIDELMPAVRREMRALDPALPLFGVRTMPQFLNRTVSIYEMGASLIGTFAVMALLLAAVGIYGVLHFTVTRRTKEIGIRMALGARYGQVLRMVLARSLTWVGAGLAIGILLALSARGITGQLVAGVTGSDPLTLAAAIFIFVAVVLTATIVPARRAARIDPLRALRHE